MKKSSRTKLRAPEFGELEDYVPSLFAESHMEQILARDQSFSFSDDTLILRECHFIGCEITGSCAGSELIDVLFERCDLSNVSFFRSSFRRVRFSACRLVGCDFSECGFQDFEVTDSTAVLSNWSASSFTNARFANTRLNESAFSSVKSKGLVFDDCDLSKADLFHMPLAEIDLSSDIIDGITTDAESLRCVAVSAQQAILLAGLLGIHVRE